MKHVPSDQHDRKNAFGRSCVRLRQSMNLTQRALGRHLGISEQAIQHWERGVRSPTPEHLTRLLALCLERHAFTSDREQEEAEQLWRAAGLQADFAAFWMRAQLAAPSAPQALVVLKQEAAAAQAPLPTAPRFDWGEALDVHDFYGREAERVLLEHWVLQERCPVVSVLGMGGIGKSALAVTLMHQLAPTFQAVVFRSLRDAPPCQDLLADCLQALSPHPLATVPPSLERRIDLLLACLQRQRCLLVLDNLETLLQAHDPQGRFRADSHDYAVLLRRVADTPHQSCLLLTSRESPAELAPWERRAAVCVLRLAGLEPEACAHLFEERDLVGRPQERLRLTQQYVGNPLALKIVAEVITELFGGEIAPFLEQGEVIFSTMRDLLAEQYARLSALEQALLTWLAVVREPVTIDELLAMLVPPVAEEQVNEALEALQRRSLVERGKQSATFTLQSVVLEYVTEALVERVSAQVQHAGWEDLIRYALAQGSAKEYVRQAQERLIVAPILMRLRAVYQGSAAVEAQLLGLLSQLRAWEAAAQGYGPANLLLLVRALRGHLRRLDLSRLAIRGAYVQGVEMQDTTLAGASVRDTTFTETLDTTWAVAISARGTFWAAGNKRGEVRVWREGGQTLHLSWQAHTDTTYALAFSPDERRLASGSWDGSVKLWELEQGALLWTQQTASINCVAFAPDGRTLASGGDDALIRLWDATTGTNVQTLADQGGAVYTLAWSPEGRWLASSGFDGSIRVWALQESRPATCVQRLAGHTNWIMGLAFAPDGSQLASGSRDRTVRLWDLASGRCLQTLTGHTERVNHVAWSRDGRMVASAGLDQTIWLWDAQRGSYHTALHGHSADVYDIAFTADSRSLLSGSADGSLLVWDVASGQCVRIIQGYAVSLSDLDWSPDGRQLVSGGTNAQVTLWEVAGGTAPRVVGRHRWVVQGVAWSPDGRLLASGGWDNTLRLWDAATGACLQVLRDPDYGDTIYQGVAWSPDGHLLACGSYLRGVQVWEVTARTRRWVGRTQPTKIRRVAWSPDGTRLASGGDDGSVCLWEAASGRLLQRLEGHRSRVASVAWSPDGRRLVSGSGGRGSGELLVWDAQSGECVRALVGHSGIVLAVVWLQRADRLVSGGSDGMLGWWDVARGECVRMLPGHEGGVQALKVSPDGRQLASGGDDSAIKVWDLESAGLLRTLRQDRPYERLNITGTRGLTEAQKATLHALGAIEGSPVNSDQHAP
jgi:WD40 repeat protein/transcriptional regulator with XRE-family HTH domain